MAGHFVMFYRYFDGYVLNSCYPVYNDEQEHNKFMYLYYEQLKF